MLAAAIALGLSLVPAQPAGAFAGNPHDSVVLLHGMARSSASMRPLAERLAAEYVVTNLDYPSTSAPLARLVSQIRSAVAACCAASPRVHFVTHSVGGILVRAYLAASQPPNLGRVVMIAPPNGGSEIVDLLGRFSLFRRFVGPTVSALRTSPGGLTHLLPQPDYELGIIAGDRAYNPLGAFVVPGLDDGAVSVEGTKLESMTDFTTVHRGHGRLTGAPEVAREVRAFLATGAFTTEAP